MRGDRVAFCAGGIAAIIAAVCYSSFVLSPWTNPAAPAGNGFISELEDPGQPWTRPPACSATRIPAPAARAASIRLSACSASWPRISPCC